MPLLVACVCASERDTVIEHAVVADDCGLADDNAHAVIDEQATADLGTWMNLDSGEEPGDLREEPSEEPQLPAPQRMADAMPPDGVHPRVEKEDNRSAHRSRVVSARSRDVLAKSNHKTLT